jgi:RNA polymerase sigma factor (TIGR02999 family)
MGAGEGSASLVQSLFARALRGQRRLDRETLDSISRIRGGQAVECRTEVMDREPSADLTRLLLAWRAGDEQALHGLMAAVEHQLLRLARRAMSGERADDTLQPTALVNELYLRLVDLTQISWNDRAHFFALAARLMRRILVDRARARRTRKRGGAMHAVELDDALEVPDQMRRPDLIALDDALTRLAAVDPRRSQVVELRFFGGLDVDEIAEALTLSRSTVIRDWTVAKAWLFRELAKENPAG